MVIFKIPKADVWTDSIFITVSLVSSRDDGTTASEKICPTTDERRIIDTATAVV